MMNDRRLLFNMPIYEYECTGCGKIEEVFQKFSEKPLSKCSHCSGKLHKLISQSTFHLKGSGWYVTDYAKKSKNTSDPAQIKKEKSTGNTGKSKKPADKTSE
jgi:putative FmdB family regulatory protein